MKTTRVALFVSLLGIASLDAALISQQPGAWSNPDTWDGVNVPQAGDDVVIQHPITLGGSTPSLNSLTMTGGSLTVSGWNTLIEATTVTLDGGNLTHTVQSDLSGTRGNYASWTPDARVWIRAVDVTVGGAASIDVNQAGYLGGWYVGSGNNSGGKGFGPGSGNNSHGGAGYGGRGNPEGDEGQPYGNFFQADDPGSGGGVHTSNIGNGGNGGGNIRIEATGTVQIDGVLTANGGNNLSRGGAGSGGGVFIQAGTLAGNGTISADGGNGTYTTAQRGGGGGGRVAVTSQASSFIGNIAVDRGNVSSAGNWPDYGTLFALTGEPTPGATSTTADDTPQLGTLLSATSSENGVQLLREIVEWTTFSMIWTDDSRDMLGNSLNNTATYTLSGLTPNFGYYQVFVDETNIFGGFVGSDGLGMLPAFNVALGSPHEIIVAIPEPASGLVLALAGLFGLCRRRRV